MEASQSSRGVREEHEPEAAQRSVETLIRQGERLAILNRNGCIRRVLEASTRPCRQGNDFYDTVRLGC
jgi:hypothetical protein